MGVRISQLFWGLLQQAHVAVFLLLRLEISTARVAFREMPEPYTGLLCVWWQVPRTTLQFRHALFSLIKAGLSTVSEGLKGSRVDSGDWV